MRQKDLKGNRCTECYEESVFLLVSGVRLRRVIREVIPPVTVWHGGLTSLYISLLAWRSEWGRSQPIHARIGRWTTVGPELISSLARGRPSPQLLPSFSPVEV